MLKRILLVCGITVAVVGGTAFYFWQQATYLPSWYAESLSDESNLLVNQQEVLQRRKQVLQKVTDSLGKPGKAASVELDEKEIGSLIEGEIVKSADKSRLPEVIKGTNTQIKDGKLSVGAVVDLNKLPPGELPQGFQEVIAQANNNVPLLKDRPLFISVEGKPIVRDRQLVLDDAARVKVGNISMTIPEISQRLGISEEQLKSQFQQGLLKLPVSVGSLEIVDDQLVIRASGAM